MEEVEAAGMINNECDLFDQMQTSIHTESAYTFNTGYQALAYNSNMDHCFCTAEVSSK